MIEQLCECCHEWENQEELFWDLEKSRLACLQGVNNMNKNDKNPISIYSTMELACRLTRLQFDKEAGSAMPSDIEEVARIERELRKRLTRLLGRDFYPPDKEIT